MQQFADSDYFGKGQIWMERQEGKMLKWVTEKERKNRQTNIQIVRLVFQNQIRKLRREDVKRCQRAKDTKDMCGRMIRKGVFYRWTKRQPIRNRLGNYDIDYIARDGGTNWQSLERDKTSFLLLFYLNEIKNRTKLIHGSPLILSLSFSLPVAPALLRVLRVQILILIRHRNSVIYFRFFVIFSIANLFQRDPRFGSNDWAPASLEGVSKEEELNAEAEQW